MSVTTPPAKAGTDNEAVLKKILEEFAAQIEQSIGKNQQDAIWEAYLSDPTCKRTPEDFRDYIEWAIDIHSKDPSAGVDAEEPEQEESKAPVVRRNGYVAYYRAVEKPLAPDKAKHGETTQTVEYYRIKDPAGEFTTVFRNHRGGLVLTPEDAIDLVAGKRFESSRTFEKADKSATYTTPVYVGALGIAENGTTRTLEVGMMDILRTKEGECFGARFRDKDQTTGEYVSWRIYAEHARGHITLGLDQMFDLGFCGETEHEGAKLRMNGEMTKDKKDNLVARPTIEWPKKAMGAATPKAPSYSKTPPARTRAPAPARGRDQETNEEDAGISF